MSPSTARKRLIAAMTIFGTISIFGTMPLPSAVIVMVRAILGSLFVGLAIRYSAGEHLHTAALKQNAPLLVCSGVALGLNWTLLFEAYHYTTVAVATLCYYMAPVFLLLLSPLVLNEPMTARKAACIAISVLGAALVSGVAGGGNLRGILLGLGAAALYCSIMVMNKKMQGLSPLEMTFLQLLISAIVITPYALMTCGMTMQRLGQSLIHFSPMLLIVGFLHTGVAYTLYFPAVNALPGQTVAVLSYLDPIVAMLISVFVMGQPITGLQMLGAALLLGGTFVSEFQKGDT